MSTKTKAHQLYKAIGNIYVGDINFSTDSATIVQGQNWEIIQEGTNLQTFVWRGYIDISGWSREDLTLFTQSVDIQRSMQPLMSAGIVTVIEYDYLTTRRMTNDEVGPIGLGRPCFLTSTPDLMECIYGEWHTWSNSSEVGTAVNTARDTFGSGNATAMDKLHITRVITPLGGGTTEGFTIYDVNYVIGAVTKEEKDLVHLERMRRSYILQGEV